MITWIASYPKSGNTWVRLFLLAYQDPDAFDMNARPVNFSNDISPWAHEKVSPVPIEDLTADEARLLRSAALLHLLKRAGGTCYMKTHCANIVVNGVALIPPEITGKSIYIVRDPRDLVISYADHLGEDIDTAIAFLSNDGLRLDRGSEIHQPVMSWSTHVSSWIKPTSFYVLVVQYEDLIAGAGACFREILDFLELPFDKTRFEKALCLTEFDTLKAAEEKHGYGGAGSKQAKFFRRGKAGEWKRVLSREQVDQIQTTHGKLMTRWGYLADAGQKKESHLCLVS